MGRILVTGGTGFIGRNLLAQLPLDSVVHLGRNIPKSFSGHSIRKLINSKENYLDCFEGVDTVIHAAARAHIMKDESSDTLSEYRKVNVEGTENLAKQAAAAGAKRFIFISSIVVNGINSLKPFIEQDPSFYHDPYSQSKCEAEEALKKIALDTGLEIVIIRPPLVYGSNAPGNFRSLLKLIAKPLPLPFGAVNNKRSMVYVENLVDFIIHCIDHPNAANQMFLISDGEDLSLKSLIIYIRKAMGKSPLLLPIPVYLFKLAGKLTGKSDVVDRLVGDLQVDSSKARELLDWAPPYTVEQGVQATVASFLKGKK